MGKILYVEDELSRNIERLQRLFFKYLTKEERAQLQQLADSDMGVTGEAVKKILADNPVLCVEYRFPDALSRVLAMSSGEEYDLCILDRNLSGKKELSGTTYELQEIQERFPDFDIELLKDYRGLEGDLLLFLMALQKVDCATKVFLLSAYRNEKIRSGLFLNQMFKLETFSKNNFIEKGDDAALDRFTKEVINDHSKAYVSFKYRNVLDYAGRLRNGGKHRVALSKALYFIEYNEFLPGFEKSSMRQIIEAIWARLDDWHYIYPGEYTSKGHSYDSGFDNYTKNYGSGVLKYLDFYYSKEGSAFHSGTVSTMGMVWKYVSEESHDSQNENESDRDFLLRSAIYAICELLRWLFEDVGGINPHPERLPNYVKDNA